MPKAEMMRTHSRLLPASLLVGHFALALALESQLAAQGAPEVLSLDGAFCQGELSCKENLNNSNHHKDGSGVWLFIQYILYKEYMQW